MSKFSMQNEIIIGFRKLIAERYQYENIQHKYQLPPSFTEARMEMFKNYFLDHLYPAPDKREELNAAFDNLDNYIKHPEKLLRILIDSGSLIFKYGRHLPRILMAGLKAMKSFREASKLEENLVESANSLSIIPPFSSSDIRKLLNRLPQKDLINFIAHNESLFETLHDRKLVKKILEIVDHLIAKMKKRPQVYAQTEVKALSLGRTIIAQGDSLFDQLSKEEQIQTLSMILKIEKDFVLTPFS